MCYGSIRWFYLQQIRVNVNRKNMCRYWRSVRSDKQIGFRRRQPCVCKLGFLSGDSAWRPLLCQPSKSTRGQLNTDSSLSHCRRAVKCVSYIETFPIQRIIYIWFMVQSKVFNFYSCVSRNLLLCRTRMHRVSMSSFDAFRSVYYISKNPFYDQYIRSPIHIVQRVLTLRLYLKFNIFTYVNR